MPAFWVHMDPQPIPKGSLKKSIFFRGWVHKYGFGTQIKPIFMASLIHLQCFIHTKVTTRTQIGDPTFQAFVTMSSRYPAGCRNFQWLHCQKKITFHFPVDSFVFKHLIISANCWQIWYRYFYVPFNLGNSNEPLKLIWLPLNWTKGAKQSDFYCCD